jgi:hypothetical protein
MSRRLLAGSAIALLATLLPPSTTSAQTRVTGVLQGSLVLLSAPSSSANVAPLHVASLAPAADTRELPGAHTLGFAGLFALPEPEAAGKVSPPTVRRVVSDTRETLTVWAPDAQRVELRLEDDTAPARTVECRRDSADSEAPTTCNAGESLPARATLTIYLRLDGSR